MVLTAFNAISTVANNNNNNNDNNNNNENDNNNNNVNINEGNNKGNIEDPNNMVNLPAAPGKRRKRLRRETTIKQHNTKYNFYCKDQGTQKALSHIIIDVIKLLPTIHKFCFDEQMIARCLPQVLCMLRKRIKKRNREILRHYSDHKSNDEDGTYEENWNELDTNQHSQLFLDVITIAVIQSCREKIVEERDEKGITSKVLLQKVLTLSIKGEENGNNCESDYQNQCAM